MATTRPGVHGQTVPKKNFKPGQIYSVELIRLAKKAGWKAGEFVIGEASNNGVYWVSWEEVLRLRERK
jgi:hypothetical protein